MCLMSKVFKEALHCPAEKFKRTDVEIGRGYEVFSTIVEEFVRFDSMPIDLNINLLDNGTGIFSTLLENKAKWHKSCRNK